VFLFAQINYQKFEKNSLFKTFSKKLISFFNSRYDFFLNENLQKGPNFYEDIPKFWKPLILEQKKLFRLHSKSFFPQKKFIECEKRFGKTTEKEEFIPI